MRDEMTIKELKALLAKYDDDATVYIIGSGTDFSEWANLRVITRQGTEIIMDFHHNDYEDDEDE